jgi:hypothetical protein
MDADSTSTATTADAFAREAEHLAHVVEMGGVVRVPHCQAADDLLTVLRHRVMFGDLAQRFEGATPESSGPFLVGPRSVLLPEVVR